MRPPAKFCHYRTGYQPHARGRASVGSGTAALESYNAETLAGFEIRQVKYLNNIVEQDHWAIERQVLPMLGFKSFRSAAGTLAGIELMDMIREVPMTGDVCPTRQFYSLAG
jgi:putative transposase